MKIETAIVAPDIASYAEQARRLEAFGYDSVVVPEAGHDPFLPLVPIAEHTERIKFGTAVAIAFPRSPMVTAQLAWDLQRFSGGRFILGLGTQVKGHNERPSFQGEHYQFTLISPFFNPGPNPAGANYVPIYISAVNKYNCRLVGELCDGIRMHPFNTAKYTNEVIVPAIEEGAKKAGRSMSDIDLVGGNFIITGATEEEVEKAKDPIRQQLSFYASTRAYHPVLEVHGWKETGEELFRYSMEGKWTEMAAAITDEMLEEFAVIGTYNQLVPKIKERCGGVLTTIGFSFGFGARTAQDNERLTSILAELKTI
ncbi:MAG TPA: LLM class flavin-dependent oxidoreductase [Dehalococcoidia bacterium]|nr:LLM class flavin-dependent oxidoreductase [Dehalococcoidia bacterium]